jgi:hypothetical protein
LTHSIYPTPKENDWLLQKETHSYIIKKLNRLLADEGIDIITQPKPFPKFIQ